MDVVEDIFGTALTDTLRQTPYNSASQFLSLLGSEKPKPSLGVACVFQTFDVSRRVVESGLPEPIYLGDGRHLAALFSHEGDLVLLDPYLLHTEPIRITAADIERGSAKVVVPAAPVRVAADGTDKPSRLTARYHRSGDQYAIRLEYSKFSRASNSYVMSRIFNLLSASGFRMPLAEMKNFDALPDDAVRAVLTDPEQTSLSIRTLDLELRRMSEVILPLQGYARGPFVPDDIWVRDFEGQVSRQSSAAAQDVWPELEAATQCTRDDIVEHLIAASEVYRKIADPNLDVAPYSLENE
ncbi:MULTISPECIES: hypothetical protein [Bacillati]|uniref:hypothetical protein n=1 Tax=Bacillati TaxID=1783272 RepID=UPI0036715B42